MTVGSWIAMKIRVDTSGLNAVQVDNATQTTSTAPFALDRLQLDVGVRLANPTTSNLYIKIDDVLCTVQ